ncbi:MAG: transporter, partial [Nitrospinales bacterium]
EKLSVGSNFGPVWITSQDESGRRDTLGQFNWTLSFGYEFFEGFGMFYEIFGNRSLSAKGKDAQSFDAGFTYLATPNIQLDASAGVGLNSVADDFFAGAGITVRFPQ